MGLTIEQIAAETRIGTRFLVAIETEQFHLLPGGIFSRGFIRAYAERLKLDPDKAVADFERQSNYREPAIMEATSVTSPTSEKKRSSLYPVAVAALIALVVVFYVVTRQATRSVTPEQPAIRATNPAPAPMPAPAAPAPTTPAPVAAESPVSPAEPAVGSATSPPAPAEQAAPQADKPSLSMTISAQKKTWIKVVADGKTANAGEILQPGTTRRYTALSKLRLMLGNAGGVDVRINDQPLRPLGKEGQIRSITITPDTLKDLVE